MTVKRVIICMCTYDGEKFLKKQIDSILAQTHHDWVLLIHDDGSRDRTIEILNEYTGSDPRIHLVSSAQHVGIKRGFINLLSYQDGDYYAFADQDDVWASNKLARLIQISENQQKEVPLLIYSNYSQIDAIGNTLVTPGMRAVPELRLSQFAVMNSVTGCTCMFNRKLRNLLVKQQKHIRFDDMHMHDWWAALVASALGKVVFCNEPLTYYRQHENNVVGAVGTVNILTRIKRFLTIDDKKNIRIAILQSQMFLDLYTSELSMANVKLLSVWTTLKKSQNFISRFHSYRKCQIWTPSRFLNLEIIILCLLPKPLRKVILDLD